MNIFQPPRRRDAEIINNLFIYLLRSVFLTLRLGVSAVIFFCLTDAQTLAPGGPGKDAQWATAAKQAIGTSASLESKIWFTLADGVMTEVLYPDVGTANVHMLQFLVVNTKTRKIESEKNALNTVFVPSEKYAIDKTLSVITYGHGRARFDVTNKPLGKPSLTFVQVTQARDRAWTIQKTYITDPNRNSISIEVQFWANDKNLTLYLYFDPSLANSGMHDTAWNENQTLVAKDGKKVSAIAASVKLTEISNGFVGRDDWSNQIKQNGRIVSTTVRAENGNVAQIARVQNNLDRPFTVALALGGSVEEVVKTANDSLREGFRSLRSKYEKGWDEYVKTLPKVDPKYQAQFNMAAMVMKSLEDKTVRGANIASPTVPWGGGGNANEGGNGYRMIWSRDLYHVFTAYLAIGDKAAAARALDFLFNIQQKPGGSFPQNSWLDGKQGWGSLQMDEVGYPLIMAWQLGRFDKQTYEKHVKPAADFIVKTGPSSPQERWEERPGYSPSTIAAEIAGLVCAADIAKRNGDTASAEHYLKTADDWQANIEKWTATTNGKYGDGNYYLRITQNGKPDAGEKVELNNNAGTFDEREIVDAGFLELVRLGIKPADDPLIAKSVKVIDRLLKVDTPNGSTFYRYNHDGYGEMDDGRKWNWDGKYTGKGRPWPLLAGERGQYELARCTQAETRPLGSVSNCLDLPKSRLDAMLAFANEGLMIPEQVWDKNEVPTNYDREFVPELKFGEGTGSATPLAWSMAQFIRLAVNLKAGKNLDTPQVVYDRYVKR
ncbi:MAG TPA: glycoside hydrolase family 15 protein [Pyrinomonadaceae bacterium]|nr:glycoside hydrolase family 15 protein [Pyrinomonadaceae bacterium]